MANQNAAAIAVLCSHLCISEGIQPLEPREWSLLAKKMLEQHIQPAEILSFGKEDLQRHFEFDEMQSERVLRLAARSSSLAFEIAKYESMGIRLVTRADTDYPCKLKKRLGNSCPPIFYSAGNLNLLSCPSVGYVGSRTVSAEDIAFTCQTVEKTVSRGCLVVSGGARGVDNVAEETALSIGGGAIAYLSDSMLRKIKKIAVSNAVQNGNLLLLSVAKPDAGFNVGMAMMRNKYIYAQSEATIVIKSDLNKGGTWSGAVDDLKAGWCPLLCREKNSLAGNKELISRGAIPIDEQWDGDISDLSRKCSQKEAAPEQISFFDIM